MTITTFWKIVPILEKKSINPFSMINWNFSTINKIVNWLKQNAKVATKFSKCFISINIAKSAIYSTEHLTGEHNFIN